MTNFRFTLLFCALMTLATQAAADPSMKELRILYQEATLATDAGEYEKARDLYLQVWEHQKTFDVGLSLAELEIHLGLPASAATHAKAALDVFPPSQDPELRKRITELLEKAQGEVATVTVDCAEGVEVRLDGESLGRAPLPEVFVEPGKHRFEAIDGERHAAQDIVLAKGERVSITLTPEAPDAPTSPTEVPPRPKPYRTIAVVAGGTLTVASAIAHVGFTVKKARLDSDADTLRSEGTEERGTRGCTDSSSAVCRELDDTLERSDRTGRWRNITLGTTVVFGAATVVAIVWPHQKRKDGSLSVTPWVARGGSGLTFEGRF